MQIACLEAPDELVNGEIFNVVQDNYQIRELAMLVAGSVGLVRGHVALDEAPKVRLHYRELRLRRGAPLRTGAATTVVAPLELPAGKAAGEVVVIDAETPAVEPDEILESKDEAFVQTNDATVEDETVIDEQTGEKREVVTDPARREVE